MVGVPRSKGCTTCRRRKVACDQHKPNCLNCQNRGVSCEGYAKYPVVLQWTPTGLKKRNRFEESGHDASSPQESTIAKEIAPRQQSSARDILFQQIGTGQIMLQQIEVQCLDSYLPQEGPVDVDLKNSWLWSIIDMNSLGTTLTSAFAALSFARVGAVNQDGNLISQSRFQYSFALSSLKYALEIPELAFQDKTLAAMRALSIYEHLSPTFAPTPPGRVHEVGMEQWCRAAGPRSVSTHFGVQIFHDVRWCIMGHSIESRKKSLLGDEEWRTVPWEHTEKDSLQQLFDIGFDLAALLEQIDMSCDSALPLEKQDQLEEIWSSCFTTFQQLEQWHNFHWPNHTCSPRHQNLDDLNDITETRTADQSPRFEFESLWQATNMIYYWTFKLILDDNVVLLPRQHAEEQSPGADLQRSSPSPRPLKSKSPPTQSIVTAGGLSTNQLEQIANTGRTLANDIVGAASYFLADDTGWLGPQRLFFPLKAAMQHLAKIQSPLFMDAQMAFRKLIARLRTNCPNRA